MAVGTIVICAVMYFVYFKLANYPSMHIRSSVAVIMLSLLLAPVAVCQSQSPRAYSRIDGIFEGWRGDTIVKLINGQIWQQAEYSYNYTYAYRPSVVIYKLESGYAMQVEGKEGSVRVKRLK